MISAQNSSLYPTTDDGRPASPIRREIQLCSRPFRDYHLFLFRVVKRSRLEVNVRAVCESVHCSAETVPSVLPGNTKGGYIHCTVDLLYD